MNRLNKIIWLVGVFFFVASGVAFAQDDVKGGKDHPMFTRMDNFYISHYQEEKFAGADFRDEKGNEVKIEGKLYKIDYNIKEGVTPPSGLQVLRNYENAIKTIGGVTVFQKSDDIWLRLDKGGKTFYVYVRSPFGDQYYLTIVEKEAMAQEVVADAKSLMSNIQATGHASVYGIYFDFDKADIKPESEPAIKEIAKLLQENQGLKLYVVGHTDNVGTIDYNMKLSKTRADAVMNELVTKYKISAQRLKAYGVGSLAPVASNKSDDGRAKNRRVELVEQ
jgi:OOP family OmpA-OmpF porin